MDKKKKCTKGREKVKGVGVERERGIKREGSRIDSAKY